MENIRAILDLWTAEPFGLKGARSALDQAGAIIEGRPPADLRPMLAGARAEAARRDFFHWPIEFPEVFTDLTPGFDAVIGNPPWEKIKFERQSFYAIHDPGLRGLQSGDARDLRLQRLLSAFPQIEREADEGVRLSATLKPFFRPENGYVAQGRGDLDLYELFCERYAALTRAGGQLGVVLPRVAFLGYGSLGFRRWLFRECKPTRLDQILNNRQWAFPQIHPQWTLVLFAAEVAHAVKGGMLVASGPSASPAEFERARADGGIPIPLDDLADWTPAVDSTEPTWEVPLAPTAEHVRLLGRIRRGPRFDLLSRGQGQKTNFTKTLAAGPRQARGPGTFREVFPTTELHEGQQRGFFTPSREGPDTVDVWKGRTFDQYDPHGAAPVGRGEWDEIVAFVQRKRLSRASRFAKAFPRDVLEDPTTHPIHRARVAFRDVTNRTNSRTAIACLVPPRTPLTHTAPYLVFPNGGPLEEAYVLGLLNSLPFDWQARRYVESHMTYFILDLLCFPPDDAVDHEGIAERAARLSCVDERYAAFASEAGVEWGPLRAGERDRLRAEIDALVARAYGLSAEELEFLFGDFTERAVPPAYRELVLERYGAL